MSRNGSAPRPAASVARAVDLAGRTRSAEAAAGVLRDQRNRAIIDAIRAGVTTRELGRLCGLTASQVSAIWRRDNPPRPRRPPEALRS